MPILAPPAEEATPGPFESSEPRRAGAGLSERVTGKAASSGGLVNAFRLVTQQRPTWRESVIGSSFLLTLGAAAVGTGALAFGIRRRQRQQA